MEPAATDASRWIGSSPAAMARPPLDSIDLLRVLVVVLPKT